ncbi:TPA_asm: transposase [Salmonella enterica subsp. houtenae serovar 45:g,z51:-]|uniref:Transposase n=1 Tax=Salmonella enterica subsp. houtenae serovar 45:g,z51:- TaxID=1967611 RepID=A0A736RC93_SALHO|nr:hypothetical protein [Salmonella enterica subsp. houtenae str. CFSAN000557]HAE7767996.1 transposase [Salmonella enterica subsp. houtenae serovar 45:g,z51:-]
MPGRLFCSAIAQVGGQKELTGQNDLDLEISNQCGRLLSSVIIYYNSALLSRLQQKYEADGNTRGLESLRRLSPVAWQQRALHFRQRRRRTGSGCHD